MKSLPSLFGLEAYVLYFPLTLYFANWLTMLKEFFLNRHELKVLKAYTYTYLHEKILRCCIVVTRKPMKV